MTVTIKLCGLTTEEAIRAANTTKVGYMGFVHFSPSPRHLALEQAAQLKTLLHKDIKSVCVLVDPTDAVLKEVQSILNPHALQLHGKETPERVSAIKKLFPSITIIKALPVRTSDDVAQASRYTSADMLLFDAKAPDTMLPGGNGLSFDWNLLKDREFPKPWMLSGGLNSDNVAEAIRQSGARAVDVSSSLESAPGVKNPALIDIFVKAVRNA